VKFKSTFFKNATILTNAGVVKKRGRGVVSNDLFLIENGVLVCDSNGKIVFSGSSQDFKSSPNFKNFKEIDLEGRVIMPALVECHTHLAFSGDRSLEFEMRLDGATYQKIYESGGGIRNTVEATRRANFGALFELSKKRVQAMQNIGIGTVEAKSGYGLSKESELKQLGVVQKLKEQFGEREIVSTFMGPHAVPKDFNGGSDRFLDEMIALLPEIKEKELAEAVDIFTEVGYFSVPQSQKFLKKAKDLGFDLRVHADELNDLGAAEMAVDLGAKSADHLLCVNESGIKALSKSETVAVILPGTSFFLNEPDAPARKLLDAGAVVALSTDFNPGSSMTYNLPLIMTMACVRLRFKVAEAVAAVTYNAAKVLGLEREKGALLPGYDADLFILDSPHYQNLVYHFGENHRYLLRE